MDGNDVMNLIPRNSDYRETAEDGNDVMSLTLKTYTGSRESNGKEPETAKDGNDVANLT
jgi:hypothetical protein